MKCIPDDEIATLGAQKNSSSQMMNGTVNIFFPYEIRRNLILNTTLGWMRLISALK